MKMLAPRNVATLVVDGYEYEPDKDGLFTVRHPGHVKQLRMHGCVDADNIKLEEIEMLRERGPVVEAERIPSDFEAQMSAKDDEIAALKAQLAEAQARGAAPETQEPSGAADTTRETVERTGDTSPAPGGGGAIPPGSETTTVPPQGQAGDNLDKTEEKLKEALAKKGDFDTMDRDQLVAWLHGVGVSVPGNISKDKAREIAGTTATELEAGLAEAAEERAKASGTSTDADSTPKS